MLYITVNLRETISHKMYVSLVLDPWSDFFFVGKLYLIMVVNPTLGGSLNFYRQLTVLMVEHILK